MHKDISFEMLPIATMPTKGDAALLDNNKIHLTSSKWILGLSVIIAVLAFLIWSFHALVGLSQISSLSILALLGGLIYALTSVNDSRVLSRRIILKRNGEGYQLESKSLSGFLTPKTFVLWASLLGTMLTWISLPVIYLLFSSTLKRHFSNLFLDLAVALEISFFGVPYFVILGILSLVSTLAYLYAVRQSLLHLVFPIIASTALTMLVGKFAFGDPIGSPVYGIPLLIFSLLAFTFSKRISIDRTKFFEQKMKISSLNGEPTGTRIAPFCGVVIVIAEVMRSLVIRYALDSVATSQRFFAAICLRSVYFSFFFLIAVIAIPVVCSLITCFGRLSFDKISTEYRRIFGLAWKHPGQLKIVMATSITFVSAFAVATPTFAYNLTSAPLIFAASQILAYPVVAAWYFTGASKPGFTERLSEVFGKIGDHDLPRFRFIFSYGVTILLCLLWLSSEF